MGFTTSPRSGTATASPGLLPGNARRCGRGPASQTSARTDNLSERLITQTSFPASVSGFYRLASPSSRRSQKLAIRRRSVGQPNWTRLAYETRLTKSRALREVSQQGMRFGTYVTNVYCTQIAVHSVRGGLPILPVAPVVALQTRTVVRVDRKTTHGEATLHLRRLWMARVADSSTRRKNFRGVAAADASQHEGRSVVEHRRRRRAALRC